MDTARGFAQWAVAAAVASGSVAVVTRARGERAGWTLAAIVWLAVIFARDPNGTELARLLEVFYGPTPTPSNSGLR